jgi:IS4 transposase
MSVYYSKITRRSNEKRAKKKGKNVSKEKLALCGWNFYVTNVDSEVFPACVIPSVYSLRWQIELVFKAIKSHLGFEFIAGKREARICCQLYGRLIVLVLSLFLTGQFRQLLWRNCQRELSLLKTLAHLPIVAPQILETLRNPQRLHTTQYRFGDYESLPNGQT